MPVQTLKDLAIRTCLKHISEITTVGDLPFHVVGEIIEKVQRPEQLMAIEEASPHIRGHTAKIWRGFILRDFPSDEKKKRLRPRNPENWGKVYGRYKRQHDEELAASLASLKSSISALKAAKDETTSKTMTRDSVRQNLHYLPPITKKRWGPPSGAANSGASSSLNFNKGTRTKILTGAGFMRKIRREASEIASMRGNLSTGALSARSSRQVQAPAAMVNDWRIAKQATFRPTAPTARDEPMQEALQGRLSVEDIEAKYISDEDEDSDGDDAFDELPPVKKNTDARIAQTPAKPTSSSSSSSSQQRQAGSPTPASQSPQQILMRKRKPTGNPFFTKRKRLV